MHQKAIRLNNGQEIPQIGLGTWRIDTAESVDRTLRSAIACGYRHIDTALIYGNEKFIGTSLNKIYKETGLKREDFFITSKLWNSYHENPSLGLEKTLTDLQTDYIDLYLIHWPVKYAATNDCTTILDQENNPVLKEFELEPLVAFMENAVKTGKIKSYGVSNFGLKNLKKVVEISKIKPVMNQIECHPYLKQVEIRDFCKQNDICVTAYSSLGSLDNGKNPKILEDAMICQIAKNRGIQPAQVILSYLMSKKCVIIPKSASEKRLKENIACSAHLLEQEDVSLIDRIDVEFRYVDPVSFGPKRFE